MANPTKYSPKLSIPGEFFPLKASPSKKSPVVVKLLTGEKVHLLAADKTPSRKQTFGKPWEFQCKSIRTIPGRNLGLENPSSIDSSPCTPASVASESSKNGCKLTRVQGHEKAQETEKKKQIMESFDSLETESIDLLIEKSSPPRTAISVRKLSQTTPGSQGSLSQDLVNQDLVSQDSVIQDPQFQNPLKDKKSAQTSLTENLLAQELSFQGPSVHDPVIQDHLSHNSSTQNSSTQIQYTLSQNPISQDSLNPPNPSFSYPSALQNLVESSLSPYSESVFHIQHPSNEVPHVASADSGSSQWLTSPQAVISFSPGDSEVAQIRLQINYTISEILQSEYAYVKSLSLLGNFFIEPLIVKSTGLRLTCTPLITMDLLLRTLREKHEYFLARVSVDSGLELLSHEMSMVVAEPSYGKYASCAEILLFLVAQQVPPFESSYVSNLQTFLERNQPGERRMDLSFSSLLQKPMGRIAKYRLFLGSLAKLCPSHISVMQALARVNAKLAQVNEEISTLKERQGVLETASEWLDLSETAIPYYHFYGLLDLVLTCTVVWLTQSRKGPVEPVFRECHIFLHANHMICADVKVQKPLFILSFANCQLVVDPSSSVGGLYCENIDAAFKIIFEKGSCQYEIMLLNKNSESHPSLLRACDAISAEPLKYIGVSDADCYIRPSIAPFDIDLAAPDSVESLITTCYFRQSYNIHHRTPGSRFQSMKVMFRRGLSWSKQE